MHYHAHVYFSADQLSLAPKIAEHLQTDVPGVQLVGIAAGPIGPHPLPMIELHLAESSIVPLKATLASLPEIKSTLIHLDTGDDILDHTSHAEWVGEKLVLDFNFFDLIRIDPSKRIHP